MELNKKKLNWSKQEIDFLINNFQKMKYEELSNFLNRTKTAINVKISELGLNKYKKLSDEEKSWLEKNYLNYKIKDIAEILNKTESSIQNYLLKYNLRKQKKGYINIPIEEIDKRIKNGISLKEVAVEFNVNHYSLKRYCLKNKYDVVLNSPEKLVKKRKEKSAKNSLFGDYKHRASKKNLEFTLTFKEFDEITDKNCYYCEEKPKNKKYANGNKKAFCFYSGIDRLDNNKGYTLENSVPCCAECNTMKFNLSLDEFLSKIEKILNKFGKK